jgi:hypothetical protein
MPQRIWLRDQEGPELVAVYVVIPGVPQSECEPFNVAIWQTSSSHFRGNQDRSVKDKAAIGAM